MLVSPFIIVCSIMVFILLFFIVFLVYKGLKLYSNILLVIFLLSQILGILNLSLFSLKDYLLPDFANLYLIGYPIVFIWSALYFFFISSILNSRFRVGKRHWYHFVPILVAIIFLSHQFFFKSIEDKILLLDQGSEFYQRLRYLDGFFNLLIIIYNVAVIVKYYDYRKRVKNFTNKPPVYDGWIRIAIFSFLIACSIASLGKIVEYSSSKFIISTYYLSLIAFLIFYSILFFVVISSPDVIAISDKKVKYWYSNLSNFEAIELMHKVDEFINEKQLYRKPSLSLKELTSTYGINERHLSQAINNVKGKNFFDYINGFRIEHAKILLTNNTEGRRTMFDIFWESGFNSKTTFNTTFKKMTGITPTEFQKSVKR